MAVFETERVRENGKMITELLDKIDGFMYYPVLIVVMAIDS
jgi:hypothetical protein